jgi:hypothetical protein
MQTVLQQAYGRGRAYAQDKYAVLSVRELVSKVRLPVLGDPNFVPPVSAHPNALKALEAAKATAKVQQAANQQYLEAMGVLDLPKG